MWRLQGRVNESTMQMKCIFWTDSYLCLNPDYLCKTDWAQGGVALDLSCLLDFDFPLGYHLPYHMYDRISLDLTYDMGDEFPLRNQSLTDIINLKQLHNVLLPLYSPIERNIQILGSFWETIT